MNERTVAHVLLAAAAMATGALGELLSPALFGYGVSVDEVIALQMLFIGLILLGFYIILGEIRPRRGGTHSPSGPVPEGANAEVPGASVEEFREHRGRNSKDRALGQMRTVGIGSMLLLAAEYASYDLFFGPTDLPIEILRIMSLFAGLSLTLDTAYIRVGMDTYHHTTVKAYSVVLVLTALLWLAAEGTSYAILLEHEGHLEPSEYVALAQLSSLALLLNVCIVSLFVGLAMYFGRLGRLETVEPTQKPA